METTSILETWMYRDSSLGTSLMKQQITGYAVEAIDGSIGKIDDATLEAGLGHLVVDTGPWIFGKKVMLPAGVIKTVDHVNENVLVNRTKDEIKNAPEFDENAIRDDEQYRSRLGGYYGGF